MKYSVEIPNQPARTIYGYRNLKIPGVYYWRANNGEVFCFGSLSGVAGASAIQDWSVYFQHPESYLPIYEPFTITIGA